MKIYLAAIYQAGTTSEANVGDHHTEAFNKARDAYPCCLESYHYLTKMRDVPPYLRGLGKTLFLDSGAFSAFTQGVTIDLQEYADFVQDNSDIIHVASNLDVIGRGNEQASWDNQKTLEKMGAKIQPVHHARDADKWLLKYLAEGYDYIFLGGMVPETTQYLRGWLDHMWGKYLTNKDGTAKIKVHGFGLTTGELMWRYPWYSVDSTSWVMNSSFGSIYLDLPHKDISISFSADSPKTKQLDQHYNTLDPVSRRAVDKRLEELGLKAEDLAAHYNSRRRANVEFFARKMKQPDAVFINRELTLF
jgi:hypothetical protein